MSKYSIGDRIKQTVNYYMARMEKKVHRLLRGSRCPRYITVVMFEKFQGSIHFEWEHWTFFRRAVIYNRTENDNWNLISVDSTWIKSKFFLSVASPEEIPNWSQDTLNKKLSILIKVFCKERIYKRPNIQDILLYVVLNTSLSEILADASPPLIWSSIHVYHSFQYLCWVKKYFS